MEDAIRMTPTQVEDLYRRHMAADFPADELKPLAHMLQMMEQGWYECLGWQEDGEMAAYACLVKGDGGDCLLDYLAVCRGRRNGGFGSQVLHALREWFVRDQTIKGLWIECESVASAKGPEEADIRRRRIGFYVRNGAVATDLSSRLFGVEYSILYYPVGRREDQETKGEAGKRRLEGIYGRMFPKNTLEKYVEVRLGGEGEAGA